MTGEHRSNDDPSAKPSTGGISIQGSAVQIGGHAVGGNLTIHGNDTVNVQQSAGADIAKLFEPVYQRIQERPEDPEVEKSEITDKVKQIQAEAAKGTEASSPKIERWFDDLARMAPDVFEVALATIANPVSGLALVAKKIAEKAKAR